MRVEVRKKRVRIQLSSVSQRLPAPQTIGADELYDSVTQQQASGGRAGSEFRPLDKVPYEPAAWQGPNFIKKTGVALLVTPPGACCTALCAYLTAFLAGKALVPLGPARYPGEVLVTTYTPHLDRAMRASISSLYPGGKNIFISKTTRRFDWKAPKSIVEKAIAHGTKGSIAAIIIDTGPLPRRLPDQVVEDATAELAEIAEKADCLVLLLVEYTSQHPDPFHRIPSALRSIRGPLLAAPLRSKALVPKPGDPAEFLLIRLPESAAYALAFRFAVTPLLDQTEATKIEWINNGFVDPREVFRRSETKDLSDAQRAAVELAVRVINQYGPTSMEDLKAIGWTTERIAPTTMRDALGTAKALKHLDRARDFNGRHYWFVPHVTPLPSHMYVPHALRDDQLPF